MRRLTMIAALAAATALTTPAWAGSPDGHLQVKLLGTAVLPDGKIDKIKSVDTSTALGAAAASPSNPQTKANDNVVPTLAIEYFFNKTFSVETICCFTQHHVSGAGDLAGTELVDHVLILPATLTAKVHLDTGGPIKPYVGVGPSVFIVFGEKPGATARALGIDRVRMSNEFGVVAQGGVDVALGDNGIGLSLDAKKYWMKRNASFYENGTLALKTRHDLNPWVLSAGLSYRF